MHWNVGRARITAIAEQPLRDIEGLIRKARGEELDAISWLSPHFRDADGKMRGVIQMFVVELNGATVIVDTCIGDGKNVPVDAHAHLAHMGLMDKFRENGFAPEQVDYVLCTHMHFDHVGLNTHKVDGIWVPTFPNARYLFARAEYDHWMAENKRPIADPEKEEHPGRRAAILFQMTQVNVHSESIAPVFEAGLADIVEPPCEPVPGFRLRPTPGHTPGHVSIEIRSDDAAALITGDSFHHPCQIARSDWYSVADADRAMSCTTRAEILNDLEGTDCLFIGSHFSEPTAGHIVRDEKMYRLDWRDLK